MAYAQGQRWKWDRSTRRGGSGFEDIGGEIGGVSNPDGDEYKSRTHAQRRAGAEEIFTDAQGGGKGRVPIRSGRSWETEADVAGDGQDVSDAGSERLAERKTEGFFGGIRTIEQQDWWSAEPGMGRVADGVPRRVDRIRGLGNAVVPQVAEWIGRRILEVEDGKIYRF